MSYITIYFDDKPVLLTNELSEKINELRHQQGNIFIDELSKNAIESLLNKIRNLEVQSAIIYDKNFEQLKKSFFKHFHFIEAAGGLVKNKKDEILLIYRREKWDLPKGKLDEDETIEHCAIREVEEETGLKDLRIIKPLESTFHTYVQDGNDILKETHWFLMQANGGQNLVPQTEEDISKILWVNKNELADYTVNTFKTIEHVLLNA
ncbi:MAG: NUDIX hydrolase [Ginsengibacter sp.]|jgi:8-oxo-dGTP pyrophosphatase MutT (NUDIX family)